MCKYSERDWPEDFEFENGNYQNKCIFCDEYFNGHKNRIICKTCDERGITSKRQYEFEKAWDEFIQSTGIPKIVDRAFSWLDRKIKKIQDKIYQ